MAAQESTRLSENDHSLSREASYRHGRVAPEEPHEISLSRELRADLLDPHAWAPILEAYGRTVKVAVALTDAGGRMLGRCHNPQPAWTFVRDALPHTEDGCPFCLPPPAGCTAVATALRTRGAVIVRDQLGLTHVAVPLFLGNQDVGAIVAGQVFDQSSETTSVSLHGLAEKAGFSFQQFRQLAGEQHQVQRDTLQVFGDLLGMLGQAFLRQRYSAILEKKLAERNRQFRSLVEGVSEYALLTMDAAGRVTSWNAGAQRLLGYAESGIVGQKFARFFTSEDIQNHIPEKQFHKASREGRTEDEGWRVREDQTRFWANVIITALAEDAGPLPSFAVIIQDVTERRKASIELERTRQERVRLQEKFLSHVSHELRTPLTAIYFFTTNLLEGVLGDMNPEQREHLTATLDNVKQLKNMVSDLLDVTRVETMKMTVEPQRTSLAALIAEVLNTCLANASLKHVGLHADVPPDLPFAWADPARVRQILTNLIDNGTKFTPASGSVSVQVRVFADDPGFLRVSVTDTGCGISPENQPIIFDHLVQVEAATEASRKGLGLGLFISRELVMRQGGRIWLESRLGAGSTFYFTLPVFSLAKLCAPILTMANLSAGPVTLFALDMATAEGTLPPELLPEIRGLLKGALVPGHDLLLPGMGETGAEGSFFVVACGEPDGVQSTSCRIRRSLSEFGRVAKLKEAVSVTTLQVRASGSELEKQNEIIARIERWIQDHLARKANLQ